MEVHFAYVYSYVSEMNNYKLLFSGKNSFLWHQSEMATEFLWHWLKMTAEFLQHQSEMAAEFLQHWLYVVNIRIIKLINFCGTG